MLYPIMLSQQYNAFRLSTRPILAADQTCHLNLTPPALFIKKQRDAYFLWPRIFSGTLTTKNQTLHVT